MDLEKAKQAYKENPMLREILKEFFTEDELTSCYISKQKTDIEFNKAFNDILKGSTQRYLNPKTNKVSKNKTTRIEVLDKYGNWLLDYNTDKKNPYFRYQYDRVYTILREQLSLQDEEEESLMKRLIATQYKMKDIHPFVWVFH